MSNKNSDASLDVLLSVKKSNNIDIDDTLIKDIYRLHVERQYEKDRSITISKKRELVESFLKKINSLIE